MTADHRLASQTVVKNLTQDTVAIVQLVTHWHLMDVLVKVRSTGWLRILSNNTVLKWWFRGGSGSGGRVRVRGQGGRRPWLHIFGSPEGPRTQEKI